MTYYKNPRILETQGVKMTKTEKVIWIVGFIVFVLVTGFNF